MPRPPRFGDAPRRGPPPASADEVARLMRRTGIVAALLVVWALAGALVSLAIGRVSGVALALAVVPAAALAALLALALDLRRPSRALSTAAAGFATMALVGAVAGHVLHWRGANLLLTLLAQPAGVRAAVFAGVLLLVPLYAGARLHALGLAWSAAGARARGSRLTLESLAREGDDALSPPAWSRAWRGALARWLQGLTLPGLLLFDVALATRRPDDRLHAETTLDALADALVAQGAAVERKPRELRVRLGDAEPLRVSPARVLLPPGPALEIRGAPSDARTLRRMMEGHASHALVFAWSQPARRWERRLNALHREAIAATSLEERSLVMEELDRVRRALDERALCGEEYAVLALKESRARALLAHRMLSEPPGPRTEARVLAQHGALMPDVARVLDAGGLSAVKRVAFVPHWILPVVTPWGEQEVVVSAATGKLDADESRALLAAMRREGPLILLDVGAQALFLPAPPPTGALLREMRGAGLVVSEGVATGRAPADVVYVPYLATPDGYASGVTGRVAPDLGNAVPVAPGL